MINIKKSGKIKVYEQCCPECGCEFTYQNEDTHLNGTYIKCPCCKTELVHSYHEADIKENEIVFTYYELYSNMKDNLHKHYASEEEAIFHIPCLNGELREGSAYIIYKISMIYIGEGKYDVIKEQVRKLFGPKYEEGSR